MEQHASDDTDDDDRVILYPAGGRFNRLRRKQHFLNDLLLNSFEGWELAQNKKEFVCRNILSKIPGGIWIFDREREIPVRTDQKDVENRILQKMRDMKKSLRGRGLKDGDAPNSPKLATTTPRRKRKRRVFHDESSEDDEDDSISYSPRKRLSRRQKDLMEKRGLDEEQDESPSDFDDDEASGEIIQENVHLEAAEIVERALHGSDNEDDDLPTPIFIDHLYESNYIPATETFCTTASMD